ncbi:hypothetical protein PR048_012501 [Dryococelus australis]|uniref:Uncharacterized protein n=1 Tax=Dryococelus australis TaxID=614101 RepID=A0ABQ9HPK3_9NEOP|nr:hypothetical protein PR048_012501 [Dryococelus australis]
MKGRCKRETLKKTRRPVASSSTIPTCKNPGVIRPGIEPGAPCVKFLFTLSVNLRATSRSRQEKDDSLTQHEEEVEDLCAGAHTSSLCFLSRPRKRVESASCTSPQTAFVVRELDKFAVHLGGSLYIAFAHSDCSTPAVRPRGSKKHTPNGSAVESIGMAACSCEV